jgi:hypothetical protein
MDEGPQPNRNVRIFCRYLEKTGRSANIAMATQMTQIGHRKFERPDASRKPRAEPNRTRSEQLNSRFDCAKQLSLGENWKWGYFGASADGLNNF